MQPTGQINGGSISDVTLLELENYPTITYSKREQYRLPLSSLWQDGPYRPPIMNSTHIYGDLPHPAFCGACRKSSVGNLCAICFADFKQKGLHT